MEPRIKRRSKPAAAELSRAGGVLCALMTVAAWAQAHETTLPTITVSADPISSDTLPSIQSARQRLGTVPGGANLVDAEQYKEGRVSTLDDALRFAPGVFVASRFGAEEARLSIRGSGLQRTFHMRGIQLLQDGVPLNLADGSVDFQAIEPLAARYVEVYRGANGLQYGSTTLGGAVNFVSPSGLSAPGIGARAEAGSFGYKRLQASVAGKSGMADWFLSGSQFFQDGYRDHAQQNTQRIVGNLGWQLNNAVETRFFLNAVRSNSELPGALTRAEMNVNPRKADPATVTGDQHRDFDLLRLSNLTSIQLAPARRLELGAFYSYKSLFHPIFQVLKQDSDDVGLNARYIDEQKVFGNSNRLIVGANVQSGSLADNRFVNVGGQPGARTGQSEQRSQNFTLFAENQYYFRPATAFVAGAQAVYAKRRLLDAFLSDGDNSVDKSYQRVAPKFGLLHQLNPQIQVYGNWSGSFEPPSFSELAGGPAVTPVDAQRASTIEIGSRGQARSAWGSWQWDASLYRAQVRKELLALTNGSGVPLGTVNSDQTIHQGVELGLQANFGRAWTARGNYLFNDFRFNGDRVYGNNQLAGVPRQILSAELLYQAVNALYAGPTVRVASASYVDHANTEQAAGYAIFGFKLGQRINKSLSWFADARNLTNKTYAATTNVVADARLDAAKRFYYPGDGRSLYVGLELRY